jgi:hypothetical protein
MSRVEKKLKWTDEKFKRQIGTTKEVFLSMLDILEAAHIERHRFGGNPKGLSVGDKLLITLKYYRHYVTMETIGDEFDRSKSTICRYIVWVEDTLSADGRFQLPGKIALQEDDVKTVGIDVMEHPIERKFGSKKESLWIGHSERVMVKHYLLLEDKDYAEASLESQVPHAEAHAFVWEEGGAGEGK